MAKPKKAGMSLGGLAVLVAIVLLARAFGIDLSSSGGSSARDPDSVLSPSGPVRAEAPRASRGPSTVESSATGSSRDDARLVEKLFAEERSGVMVTVRAEVVHVLPDDNEGSRHQRFLIELSPKRTLLVAHNIDLADRVPLDEGDAVVVCGQYEWSEKGGTLHWTHHDPGNRREGGWIEHSGVRYE